MSQENYTINVVDECLDIFFLLCEPEFQAHTEKEIGDTLGIKKNKVYRMLKTMEHRKLVRKHNGYWKVAPGIVKISDGFRLYIARKRAELDDLEREYLGQNIMELA
jgi:DNA-binding IclR family transcriptional regulator